VLRDFFFYYATVSQKEKKTDLHSKAEVENKQIQPYIQKQKLKINKYSPTFKSRS